MPNAKLLESPPWKIVALRWLKTKTPLEELYRRLGWSKGKQTIRVRCPDLRLSHAVQIADALEVPRGQFLAQLAELAIGPEPKLPPIDKRVSLAKARSLDETQPRRAGALSKRVLAGK